MQIVELATKLQSVGLTDKQARVYVAALFLGPSAVQKIAEQAEINRATTYVILDELASMGMVSESTEGKKTVFVAEPPQAIERYLEAQNQQITDKKDQLKNILPSLKEVSRSFDGTDTPVVRFYKGEEGAINAANEFYRKAKLGSSVYSLLNLDHLNDTNPMLLQESAIKQKKKNISNRVLYSYKNGELKSNRDDKRDTIKLAEEVTADFTIFENGAILTTYGEKESTGIVIESKEIVSALRLLFERAWNDAKKQK